MYCPKCGASQSDELNFCKLCGANLSVVRQAVEAHESGTKLDWNKTWMAEALLSQEERIRRRRERRSIEDPEERRNSEIKGGIITCCVGVGMMIFLYVLMQGIIKGADLPGVAVEILSRVWIAGVMPFMVGIGLLLHANFVTRKGLKPGAEEKGTREIAQGGTEHKPLPAADTKEFITPEFSVTEGTTRHMKSPTPGQ